MSARDAKAARGGPHDPCGCCHSIIAQQLHAAPSQVVNACGWVGATQRWAAGRGLMACARTKRNSATRKTPANPAALADGLPPMPMGFVRTQVLEVDAHASVQDMIHAAIHSYGAAATLREVRAGSLPSSSTSRRFASSQSLSGRMLARPHVAM